MLSQVRFQLYTFATATTTAVAAYDAVVVDGSGTCAVFVFSVLPDTLTLLCFFVFLSLLVLGFAFVWAWRLRWIGKEWRKEEWHIWFYLHGNRRWCFPPDEVDSGLAIWQT